MRGRACWVAAVLLVWIGCMTTMRPDPTLEHPWVGCIADSPLAIAQRPAPGGGRLLPEVVRVIGATSGEDGERWKVLRAGEFNPERWQPWEKEKIQFQGCGAEADAVQQVFAARSVEQ